MRGVSIITSTIKPQFMDNIFENYDRQNWAEKELIVILNKDDMEIDQWNKLAQNYKNVSVHQLPEHLTLGECLNYGIEKSQYGHVAKFDDDDYYGPDYLTQAMDAFENTDAVLVGKRTAYTYFKNEQILTMTGRSKFENQYIKKVMKGGTLVLDKSIFPEVQFPPKNLSEDVGIQRQCLEKGYQMFSTDRKNYAYVRHGDETHTSHKKNHLLIKQNKFIAHTADLKRYVDSKEQNE